MSTSNTNSHHDRMTDVWTEWMEARADNDEPRADDLSKTFWSIGAASPTPGSPDSIVHHLEFLVACGSPDVPTKRTWSTGDAQRRDVMAVVIDPATPAHMVLPLLKSLEDISSFTATLFLLPEAFRPIVRHGFGPNTSLVLSQFFKRRILEQAKFGYLMRDAAREDPDALRTFIKGLLAWARPDDSPHAFVQDQPVDWIVKLGLLPPLIGAMLAEICAGDTLPPCPRSPSIMPFSMFGNGRGTYLATIIARFGDEPDGYNDEPPMKLWLRAEGRPSLNEEEHFHLVEWKLKKALYDVRDPDVQAAVAACMKDFPESLVREFVLANVLGAGVRSGTEGVPPEAVDRIDIVALNIYDNMAPPRLSICMDNWRCNILFSALYARKYELAVKLVERYGSKGCTEAHLHCPDADFSNGDFYIARDTPSADRWITPLGVIRQIVESGNLGTWASPLTLEAQLDVDDVVKTAWLDVGGKAAFEEWSASADPVKRAAAKQLTVRAAQVCGGRFLSRVGRDLADAPRLSATKNLLAKVLEEVRAEFLSGDGDTHDSDDSDDDSVRGVEETKGDVEETETKTADVSVDSGASDAAMPLTKGNWRYLAHALLQSYGSGTEAEEAWLKSELDLDTEKVVLSKRWFKRKAFSPNSFLHGVAVVDVVYRFFHDIGLFLKLIKKPGFDADSGGYLAGKRWDLILDTSYTSPGLRARVIRKYLKTSPPTPAAVVARLAKEPDGGFAAADWVQKNVRKGKLFTVGVAESVQQHIDDAKEREDALVARVAALESALEAALARLTAVETGVPAPLFDDGGDDAPNDGDGGGDDAPNDKRQSNADGTALEDVKPLPLNDLKSES